MRVWSATGQKARVRAKCVRAKVVRCEVRACGQKSVTPNTLVVVGIISDLINSGADPNVKSPSNESLLMTAVSRRCVDVVKVLLNATDIDVNAKDDMNRSALWLAVDAWSVLFFKFFNLYFPDIRRIR